MMQRTATFLLLAVIPAVNGCGTVLNLQGEPRVYGGVLLDATVGPACLAHGIGLIRPEAHEKFSPETNLVLGGCALADLPFSAVADTFTLPLTVSAALKALAGGDKLGAQPGEQQHGAEGPPTTWPKDWSGHVGQAITLEGTAGNAKLGAVLVGEGGDVWIDGLDEWPQGLCGVDGEGRRVRVTGTVISRDDLPVFVQVEGEPVQAGMPVPPGTDLSKARRRFLLKDATWTVLD